MTDQEEALGQLTGQFKRLVMQLLNETADEFEVMELTDDQRRIYNEFTGILGQKVLSVRIVQAEED